MRALCGIEALLEHTCSPSAGEVGVHFQTHVSIIRRAQQSAQATVRQRADRVLRLLGGDTLPAEGSGVKASQDLLGEDLVVGTESALSGQSTQSTQSTMDLLAGLDAAPATTSFAASPGAPSQGFDMLGDLMGAPAPAAMAPPPPTPAMPAVQPVDDFFGDWSAPTESQPSPVAPQFSATAVAPFTSAPFQQSPLSAPQSGSMNILDALSDLSINSGPSSQPAQPNLFMGLDSLSPTKRMGSAATQSFQQQSYAAAAPPANTFSPQVGGPLDDFFSMPASTTAQALPSPMRYTSPGAGFNAFKAPAAGQPAPLGSGGSFSMQNQPGLVMRNPSLGLNTNNDDVLGAINAATSGISSAKREDVAFDFVQGAMAQLKTKK